MRRGEPEPDFPYTEKAAHLRKQFIKLNTFSKVAEINFHEIFRLLLLPFKYNFSCFVHNDMVYHIVCILATLVDY